MQTLSIDGVVFRPIELDPSVRSELFLVWKEHNDNPAFEHIVQSFQRLAETMN
jgi:hypothetical protein